MKRRFYEKSFIWMIVVCVCVLFGTTQKASAAGNGVVEFDLWKAQEQTYTKYDVTGDGKEDTVRIVITNNQDEQYSGTIKVYVNDNIVFDQTREPDPVWRVKLIKLDNGNVFFDIESTIVSDDAGQHKIYEWKDGKLKTVYDFQKYYDKYAAYYSVDVVKVSGNTIKTKVTAQFYITGMIGFDMNVVYKDGKFKRTSNSFSPKYKSRKNKWTAGRKIKVYKKAGAKKIAYTLKKGNTVKLDKILYKNNKVYFKVKRSKGKVKTGYIPGVKKWADPQYFKEAQFAG